MIVCHPKKLIFVKAKKVAGTSFEIVLSKYCGEQCIITPISTGDEKTRQSLGFRGAQNFADQVQDDEQSQNQDDFRNHMPAQQVKDLIPAQVWDTYTKIAIVRDPFDTAISRYFWMGRQVENLTFLEYLNSYSDHLTENSEIAPLSGDAQLDHYLRYENMQHDLNAAGLGYLWTDFDNMRAKGDRRPKVGASVADIYAQYPQAIDLVEKACADQIERFGYRRPDLPAASA